MKSNVIIIGGRPDGHGKVAIAIAKATSELRVAGFLDDNESVQEVEGAPRLGSSSDWKSFADQHSFHVAIGDNMIRRSIANQIASAGGELATLIHPQAILYPSAQVGPGSMIAAGAILGPDVTVGANCIVNHGAVLDHDGRLHDHVNLSTGFHAGGRVRIEEGVFAGVGAAAIPDIRLAAWTYLGAGCVAHRDTEPATLYVGVPARRLRSLSAGEAPAATDTR